MGIKKKFTKPGAQVYTGISKDDVELGEGQRFTAPGEELNEGETLYASVNTDDEGGGYQVAGPNQKLGPAPTAPRKKIAYVPSGKDSKMTKSNDMQSGDGVKSTSGTGKRKKIKYQ